MVSSDSDDHTSTRKRARATISTDDSGGYGKKQRGRPRVDTQDETAADRRRTQIRLAQRAYRQRKETTISALKGRVSVLESTIEVMSKTYLRFNDSAMSSKAFTVQTEIVKELKKTTETFVKLARVVDRDSDCEEEDLDIEDVPTEKAIVRKGNPAENVQLSNPQESMPDHLDIAWGYSHMYDSQTQNAALRSSQDMQMATFISGLPAHRPNAQPTALPFGLLVDPLDDINNNNTTPYQVNVRVPTPPVIPMQHFGPEIGNLATIRPARSYSHHETSLGRRIHRVCIESGLNLLITSAARPNIYKHVFRLSLISATRDQLIQRFSQLLTRSNTESLDVWNVPYIHLGGAGTHYPQRDANGNIIPKVNSWTVRGMGPYPPRVRFVSNDGKVEEIDVNLSGYHGEWFDPYDVQGYLEEKGCIVDNGAQYVQAWIDPPEVPLDMISDSPLAMDLGMSIGNMDPSNYNLPPYNGSASPPLVGSLSSSRSSSGSVSMLSGHSTPPTPNLSDLGFDLNEMPPADMFPELDISNDFNPIIKSAPYPYPPAANKDSLNPQQDGLFQGFQFDTDGILHGISNVVKQKTKVLVTIDTNKFIQGMIGHAVCLGRSPGFRRTDVDRVLLASIVPPFSADFS